MIEIYRNISLTKEQFDAFMKESIALNEYYLTYQMMQDAEELFFEKCYPVTQSTAEMFTDHRLILSVINDCEKCLKKFGLPFRSVSISYQIYDDKKKEYLPEVRFY